MSFFPRSLRHFPQASLSVTRQPFSKVKCLHVSSIQRAFSKDDQMDREAVNPTSSEYSKTGGDGTVAHEKEAFDPSTTRPETEEAQGREGKDKGEHQNPLNVSPGNTEINGQKNADAKGKEESPNQSQGGRKMSGGSNH